MTLWDRVRRWWSPAKWRDEHPEVSDGEGYALTEEERLETQTSSSLREGMYHGPRQEGEGPRFPVDPGRY